MARILVIDDDELLRRFVVALLERRDYSVQSTDSGETGIKLAAVHDFDLIITDIVMPGTEGLETIKQIRRNKPAIKILAVSGGGSSKGDYLGKASSNVERVNINFANPDPALGDNRSEPTTKHPFFNGPDGLIVRQALAMATDRATIGDQLYGNGLTGTSTCNQLLGNDDWTSKNTASMSVCKFDTAAANKLLDDNGWAKGSDGVRAKGGIKLNVLFATTVNALRQKEQDILKANWEAVGFKVELRSIAGGVFFSNAADGANRFYYDLSMFTNGTAPDITGYMSNWTTKQIAQKSNNWNQQNYHRYSNPAYDAIVEQMRTTTDQAKLNQLGIQANDILIKDVVVIPLVNRFQVASGKSKALQGTNLNPWDSEMWNIADWYKTP